MELVSTLFSAIVRITFRLVLLAAALVFILSLLCVALVSLTWVLLKALLTGRKPAFVTTFTRFRQASQQFRSGEWPARAGAAGAARRPCWPATTGSARIIRPRRHRNHCPRSGPHLLRPFLTRAWACRA